MIYESEKRTSEPVAQMPERLRQEAVECAERLVSFQATLTEATNLFIQYKVAAGRSCKVADLIAKVIETKKLAERSHCYLANLRLIGGDFARFCPEKFVSDVTPEDVEKWVARRKHSPTTRNNRTRTFLLGVLICSQAQMVRIQRG